MEKPIALQDVKAEVYRVIIVMVVVVVVVV
jgi:hypothetical protein